MVSSSTNMACPFAIDYCGAIPIPIDIEKETLFKKDLFKLNYKVKRSKLLFFKLIISILEPRCE